VADNKQRKKKGCRAAGRRSGGYSHWLQSGYGGGPLARQLRRVIRSSGFEEGKRWAEKQAGIDEARLLSLLYAKRPDGKKEMPMWLHKKMVEALRRRLRKEHPDKQTPAQL